MYQFRPVLNCTVLREELLARCNEQGIKGTILVAPEGINGTVAGDRQATGILKQQLELEMGFTGLEWKVSVTDVIPFRRMKVKIKKEIVTMGLNDMDAMRQSGIKVSAQQWNQLISDPDTLVIDTRNTYECELGRFANAMSPEMDSFREFPKFVDEQLDPGEHARVAMYCTGGIRCEKASAYMLSRGFSEVFHLDGGILRYLETVDPDQSLWSGECFVFDDRVAVDANLARGEYELCYGCRRPVSPADRESRQFEQGVSCPRCFGTLTRSRRRAFRERQRQVELAGRRGEDHIGAIMPPNVRAKVRDKN